MAAELIPIQPERTAAATLNDIVGDRYTEAARRVAASKHLLECCERRTFRRDLLRLLRHPDKGPLLSGSVRSCPLPPRN